MAPTQDPIMDGIELTLKRKMLKWHTGHTMFCPRCQTILDCRRSVEIDVMKPTTDDSDSNGIHGNIGEPQLLASKILCATCYDHVAIDFHAAMTARGLTVETTDGRTVFGRNGRKR